MRLYGETGECFVRLRKNGVSGRNLTLCANEAGVLELYVKTEYNARDCRLELRPDGGDTSVLSASVSGESDGYVRFDAPVTLTAPGLYFFRFALETRLGTRYVTDDCGLDALSDSPDADLQLLCHDDIYNSPEWLSGGVFYQIFIDRFARGGSVPVREDAVMMNGWEGVTPEYNDGRHVFKNNTFFGGTLWGAADKLDYLQALGVTCVYLSPCFKAYSNHKYDVGDYMSVDEMFGGDEALAFFVSEAGKRNMRVILDGVFNHVGDDSRYFDAYGHYGDGACQSKQSPYYDWFTFTEYPKAYDCWWGISNLPKIRLNDGFKKLICENVIPKYMSMGVYGWRLDVVDELQSDFLDELVKAVKRCRSDALVLGEVWEDASNKVAYSERKRYFYGAQLDSVMNYPLRNGIIDFLTTSDSTLLKNTCLTLIRHYPPKQLSHTMNIVGTHDTERILTSLGGGDVSECGDDELANRFLAPEERENAALKVKIAYTILAFMPGVPCIYYGDEVGMEGYHDPFCRRPFPWHSGDGTLRKHFSAVNALRESEKALRDAETEIFDCESDMFICRRENLLLCVNLSDGERYAFDIALPPRSAGIYKLTEEQKWSRML